MASGAAFAWGNGNFSNSRKTECIKRRINVDNKKNENGGNVIEKLQNNLRSLDGASIPWVVLGFCLPVVGLILYLLWRETREADAKAAGTGAALSFALSAMFYLLAMGSTVTRIIL